MEMSLGSYPARVLGFLASTLRRSHQKEIGWSLGNGGFSRGASMRLHDVRTAFTAACFALSMVMAGGAPPPSRPPAVAPPFSHGPGVGEPRRPPGAGSAAQAPPPSGGGPPGAG